LVAACSKAGVSVTNRIFMVSMSPVTVRRANNQRSMTNLSFTESSVTATWFTAWRGQKRLPRAEVPVCTGPPSLRLGSTNTSNNLQTGVA
jgi:hypothetical protein